jgi:ligand-binding sensor domain-containing protein
LWIGTSSGVTRLRDGVFTTFGEREGLVGNEVRAFHEDADGQLWIGTYDGGLYRLVEDQLTRYRRTEGLHDNSMGDRRTTTRYRRYPGARRSTRWSRYSTC